MELHYTLDKRGFRRQITALARVKGSAAWQMVRGYRIFILAVFGLAFLFLALCSGIDTYSPAAAAALVVCFLLFAAAAAFLCAFAGNLAAWQQARLLGRGLQEINGSICTLRLQDGTLYYKGPAVGALASQVTCPASTLRAVQTDAFGLVLVFRNGAGLAVPLPAFSREQPLPRWKQALEQAMRAPSPAVPPDTSPDGISRDAAGQTVVVQRLDREQARTACLELNRAAMRTGAYWRRNLAAIPLLLIILLYLIGVAAYNPLFLLLFAALLAAAYGFRRYSMRKLAERAAGRIVTVFGPDAMIRTGSGGAGTSLPYTAEVKLLTTPHAIALYQPRYSSLFFFYRQAFASPQEEAELLALLKRHFPGAN